MIFEAFIFSLYVNSLLIISAVKNAPKPSGYLYFSGLTILEYANTPNPKRKNTHANIRAIIFAFLFINVTSFSMHN